MTVERSRLVILGIDEEGLGGLTDRARRILADADVIVGAAPILALLESLPGRKVVLEPEMSKALEQVKESLRARQPVLVSSGDPLFYGVAPISAIDWARTASRSCRTSAACNWHSHGSRRAGKTPT